MAKMSMETATFVVKVFKKTGGFFIEVPIANQLQKFFTGKCIIVVLYCVELTVRTS